MMWCILLLAHSLFLLKKDRSTSFPSSSPPFDFASASAVILVKRSKRDHSFLASCVKSATTDARRNTSTDRWKKPFPNIFLS